MATLFTDRANHQALKGILSALLSRRPLTVSICAPNFKARLPWLESPELPKPLFSANDVAAYLYQATPAPQSPLAVESTLEWEATTFTSETSPLYTQRQLNDSVLAAFKAVNDMLSEKPFEGVAELVMWCSVLPALCDEGLLPDEHRANLPTLVSWFDTFLREKNEVIQEAFALLGVQEQGDFLRVRRVFRIRPSAAKPFYVTTPIYYVNAAPHIGHVYSTLVADALSRYHKVKGEKTFFCTGTDEHGQKVAQAAEAKGQSPMEFCTSVSNEFRECFDNFGLQYDHFIRTTDAAHESNVQELWTELERKGDIYLGKYEGWYCVSDENFCTELNVKDGFHPKTGEPCKVSIESGNPVIWITEENYKFKLSAFQQPLLDWLINTPGCIVPEFRRREIIKFVQGGLFDLSISRKKETCSWGVAIPGTDRHVMYVWLDALSNYFTASRLNDKKELAKWEEIGLWPADLHVIGKDILKFHAVYWPAFLLSAGLPLPKKIIAHGWWTKDKKKISKTLGNVFDPFEKAAQFGMDALKYYLFRESSFGDDPDYSDNQMISRLNGDLADTYGNLVMRCVAPKLNPEAVWPALGQLTKGDETLIQHIKELPGIVDHYFLIPDTQRAVIAIFDLLREANVYISENEPWNLIKQGNPRLATVLYLAMECTRICTTLLQPIMPVISKKILDQLGVPSELRTGLPALEFGAIPAGTKLNPTPDDILFPKFITKK